MGTFWQDTRCGFRMLARNPTLPVNGRHFLEWCPRLAHHSTVPIFHCSSTRLESYNDDFVARRTLCLSRVAEESGLRRHGGIDAGPGHRGQQCLVQRHSQRASQAPALPRSAAPGSGAVDRHGLGQTDRSPAGMVLSAVRGAAGAWPGFRPDRGLCRRFADSDAGWRARAGGGGIGVGGVFLPVGSQSLSLDASSKSRKTERRVRSPWRSSAMGSGIAASERRRTCSARPCA